MFDFKDRVVVVTGAAGNLGFAVAKAFEQAGAKLVLLDHAMDRLQTLFPEIAESADHFLAVGVDLEDASAVSVVAEETLNRLGRVDVLVNTVGGYRAGTPVHEMSMEDWELMMNLNARSVFVTCRAFAAHMVQQSSGRIINLSSRAALGAGGGDSAYAASKSAVIRLTESLSAELKHYGINVNCVLPGLIDTPANRRAIPDADYQRWVTTEALADVILFLASDAARAIHGAAIPVYGLG